MTVLFIVKIHLVWNLLPRKGIAQHRWDRKRNYNLQPEMPVFLIVVPIITEFRCGLKKLS